MTRYVRELYPGCTLAFGWDRPLASYFAQIIEDPPDQDLMDESHPDYWDQEEIIHLDIGCNLKMVDDHWVEDSIRSADELASQLEKAGWPLTEQEIAQLVLDKEDLGMWRTPFMEQVMAQFDELANIERLPRDED